MLIAKVFSRYGTMLVPENDMYIGKSFLHYGEFSEAECAVFKQIIKPDWIVADIGANLGAHTLFFAKHAAKVYAAEPQRDVFAILKDMVGLNELDNVELINAGISDCEGETVGCEIDLESPNSCGGYEIAEGVKYAGDNGYPIKLMKFEHPCHFMKIDVEGMEEQVIRGSADMIREFQPILYVENDREKSSASLINAIRELDYGLYWHLAPLYNPDNWFGNRQDVFPELVSANMLCLPQHGKVHGLEPVTTPLKAGYCYTY